MNLDLCHRIYCGQAQKKRRIGVIIGAHTIIYSKNPEADRDFLREVLKFPYVDAGHGWLIFALPPSEVAIHPSDENDQHQLYLICDDVKEIIRTLEGKHVVCSQ